MNGGCGLPLTRWSTGLAPQTPPRRGLKTGNLTRERSVGGGLVPRCQNGHPRRRPI